MPQPAPGSGGRVLRGPGKKAPGKKGGRGGGGFVMPPDPNLTITGPGKKPKPGKLKVENLNSGIGKIEDKLRQDRQRIAEQLRKDRKKGKNAATGQLGTISDKVAGQVGEQFKKYDKTTQRILDNQAKAGKRQREFFKGQRQGIKAEQQRLMANGGVMASGMTGSRSRTTRDAGKVAEGIAAAQRQEGRDTAKAGRKAISSTYGFERRQDKTSMSILDVLGAEQKREDTMFIEEMKHADKQTIMGMRHDERVMELQFAQDVRMNQLQFDQSIYTMEKQQQLTQEYTQWQLDNDLMLTPEQQAALDYRYTKKETMLSQRLNRQNAQNSGNKEAFESYDSQMTLAEDAVQTATEVMTTPSMRNAAESIYKAEHDIAPDVQLSDAHKTTAYSDYIDAKVIRNAPEGVSSYAATKAVDAVVAGGGAENEAGNTVAPGYDQLSEWVRDNSPQGVGKYIQDHPKSLRQGHQDYRELRASMSPLNPEYATQMDPGSQDQQIVGGANTEGDTGFFDKILGIAGAPGGPIGTAKAIWDETPMAAKALVGGASNIATGVGLTKAAMAAKAGGPISHVLSMFKGASPGGQAVANTLSRLGFGPGSQVPNTLLNAAGKALPRAGAAVAGEAGFATSSVLASAGLYTAAALAAYKLGDLAINDGIIPAEAREGDLMTSTINQLDGAAESVIAGTMDMSQFDKIADNAGVNPVAPDGSAAEGWADMGIGWVTDQFGPDSMFDDEQMEVIRNKVAALRPYIEEAQAGRS